MLVYHEFLVKNKSIESASEKVRDFLSRYSLVNYDSVNFIEKRSCNAMDGSFHTRLELSLKDNSKILLTFIQELKAEGVNSVDDIAKLHVGYKSKLLHVITHFVDGFFGIDSSFYNLIEGSHWVSDYMLEMIRKKPGEFWIVAVDGETGEMGGQGFERLKGVKGDNQNDSMGL